MKILVINPGSTSTKWAVYNDRELLWKGVRNHTTDELRHFSHVNDQLQMRTQATYDALAEAAIEPKYDVDIALC